MTFEEIKSKIQSARTADFGTVFNQSLELFKKTWTQGLIMMILMMVFIFALEFLIFFPISILVAGSSLLKTSDFDNFSILMIVVFVIGFFAVITLMISVVIGLTGGLYIIYKKADHNENYSSSDFFTLLKREYLGKTIRLGLVQIGITIGFAMMCYFPLFYAMIPISYLVVIYAYNPNLSVREIVKLSFAIGNKNWGTTFLLRMVTGMVAMLGIFLCGIGLLATFAIVLIPEYFIYKQTVGFKDNNEIDAIGLPDDVV